MLISELPLQWPLFLIFELYAVARETPTLPDSTPFQGPFSYIFCSEILYLPQLHRALLKTLTRFSDETTVVLLLWKQRGLGEERFFGLASRPSAGWHVEQVKLIFYLHKRKEESRFLTFMSALSSILNTCKAR